MDGRLRVTESAQQEYAGFGRRLVAYLLDGLVIGGGVIAITYLSCHILRGAALMCAILACTLAKFAYRPICHSVWGKTLGKKCVGLRVTTSAGDFIGPLRALLREVFFVPGFLIGIIAAFIVLSHSPTLSSPSELKKVMGIFYGAHMPMVQTALMVYALLVTLAQIVSVIGHPKHKALHDLVAGTVVLLERPAVKPRPAGPEAVESATSSISQPAAGPLHSIIANHPYMAAGSALAVAVVSLFFIRGCWATAYSGRHIRLVVCSAADVSFSLRLPEGHGVQLLLAVPGEKPRPGETHAPFEFQGRVGIYAEGKALTDFSVSTAQAEFSRSLRPGGAAYALTGPGMPGRLLTSRRRREGVARLDDHVRARERYEFRISFEKPPPENAVLWLSWMQPNKNRPRTEEEREKERQEIGLTVFVKDRASPKDTR